MEYLTYQLISGAVSHVFQEGKAKLVFNEKGSKIELEANILGVLPVKKEIAIAVPEAIRSRMPESMLARCQERLPSIFGKPEKELEAAQKEAAQKQDSEPKRDTPEQTQEKFQRYTSSAGREERERLSTEFYAASKLVAASRSLPDGDAKEQAAMLGEKVQRSRESTQELMNLNRQHNMGVDGRTLRDLDPQQREAYREAYVKVIEDRVAVSNMAIQYRKEFGDISRDGPSQPPAEPSTSPSHIEEKRAVEADGRIGGDETATTQRQDRERAQVAAAQPEHEMRGDVRESAARQTGDQRTSRLADLVPESRASELGRANSGEHGGTRASTSDPPSRRSTPGAYAQSSRLAELVPESRVRELGRTSSAEGRERTAESGTQRSSLDKFESGSVQQASASQTQPSRLSALVPESRASELQRPGSGQHRDPTAHAADASRHDSQRAGPGAAQERSSVTAVAADRGQAQSSNLARLEQGREHQAARAGERTPSSAEQLSSAGERRQPASRSGSDLRSDERTQSHVPPVPRLTPENEAWYKQAVAEGARDVAASRDRLSDERAGERAEKREQHEQALTAARADFNSPDEQRAASAAAISQAQSDFTRADDRLGQVMERHQIRSADDVSKLSPQDRHEFARAHLDAAEARDRIADLGEQHQRQFGPARADANAAKPREEKAPAHENAATRENADGAARQPSFGERFHNEERERQQHVQQEQARQNADSQSANGRSM